MSITKKTNWETKKLGDYYDITSSKRVFKSEWKNTGVPFYRAREIVKLSQFGFVNNELFISEEMYNKYSKVYGVPKIGDIMVTGVGTLGICYVIKEDLKFYFKDGNIIWLRRKNEINTQYVEYAFKSDMVRKQIDNSIGATVGTLTIIKAKNIQIPLPPLSEQHRIVKILDEIFADVANVKENLRKNLQNSKDLFESYLHGVFSNSWKNWNWKRLGDVCNTGAGGTPLKAHREYYENGNIAWLRSGEVNKKEITKSELYITQKGFNNSSARLFTNNTVLVAMYGATAGQTGILRFKSSTNQAVCGILPNINFVPEFIYYYFTAKKNDLVNQAVGNAQPNISQIKIKNTNIPILTVSEQKSIVSKLDALSTETKKLEEIYKQKLDDLEELKKSILKCAFNGEL